MGEVKSVKVDNWGVFFLQKLQNFFNKTDYCDLTLQFNDNSQLKVHRLVLNACTDYFNGLEETCEMVDDALIMPNEYQADVVVPIVNFMYTGTLEFELTMYDKLLHTAKEMNMTVLLKLLEAHRRTMESTQKAQRPPTPRALRRAPRPGAGTATASRSVNVHGVTITPTSRTGGTPAARGAGAGSGIVRVKQEPNTSPFEQLRKGYNNNKRPASTDILQPAAKKPNLQDVKEFAEQQRMRKMIAAEYIDDQPDYDALMDDDVHTDDDDDEPSNVPQQQPSTSLTRQQQQTSNTGGQVTEIKYGGATIVFQREKDGQPPVIIVKDSPGKSANHTKLINDLLQKYPDLLRGQKNVKLRVMVNSKQTSHAQTAIKQEQQQRSELPPELSQKRLQNITIKKIEKPQATPSSGLQPQRPSQRVAASTTVTSTSRAAPALPKRRIDSKTMHALLALGAENTTGPWLCLRCGLNGRPISIPSYISFRRHLVNTHKETIDKALCEHCGWRSSNPCELHFHIYVDHKVKSELYQFPPCTECGQVFMNEDQLEIHFSEKHPEACKRQKCLYCDELFFKEWDLYDHLKTYHRNEALEDGVIDEAGDEEYLRDEDGTEDFITEVTNNSSSTVKILSNVTLPCTDAQGNRSQNESNSKYAQLRTVDSFVPTKNTEVQFITEDGSQMHLTPEEQQSLLAQFSQENKMQALGDDKVLLTVNECSNKSAAAQEEVGEVVATERPLSTTYSDDQIYSELVGNKTANASCELEESKESNENLEWAEKLIMQHDEHLEQKIEKDVEINDKLKQLTSDWTEDENEDDDVDPQPEPAAECANIASKSAAEANAEAEPEPEPIEQLVEQAVEIEEVVDKGNKSELDSSAEIEDDVDRALRNLHKGTLPEEADIEIEAQDKAVVSQAVINIAEQTNEGVKLVGEVEQEAQEQQRAEVDVDLETESLRNSLIAELEGEEQEEDVKAHEEEVKAHVEDVVEEVAVAENEEETLEAAVQKVVEEIAECHEEQVGKEEQLTEAVEASAVDAAADPSSTGLDKAQVLMGDWIAEGADEQNAEQQPSEVVD